MFQIELFFRLEKEELVSISVRLLLSMQDLNLSCVIMQTGCLLFISASFVLVIVSNPLIAKPDFF